MSTSITTTTEPNPPQWPDTVKIFYPTDSIGDIRARIKETEDSYRQAGATFTSDYHFSTRRFALLFAPGEYRNLDLEVGYYVQILGLGKSPDDVLFRDCAKGVYVPALNKHLHPPHGTSLDTFWRSAENFSSQPREGMQWAVSQAAPLRRIHVLGDLHLHDGAAYASGGHVANSHIEGQTFFGGQQQFLSRNVHFGGGTSGGAWSLVFVGCTGDVPEPHSGTPTSCAKTVTPVPKLRIEKPYISMQQNDTTKFDLRIPKLILPSEDGKEVPLVGPHVSDDLEDVRDFNRVAVISVHKDSSTDVTSMIQRALDDGKDVILTPGIYQLTKTLTVHTDNQVLLGLGLATLVAPKDGSGSPCLHVLAKTAGVSIAGIMLEASELETDHPFPQPIPNSTLLLWGEDGIDDPGNPKNPGTMFDIFCRVGGGSGNRTAMALDSMVIIHSGNVIGDNIWLWRADHSELGQDEEPNYPQISPIFHQNEGNEHRVKTGIQVLGDDVAFYGLAVEHTNEHQTIWSGDRGSVHFYQCEFPYDASRTFSHHGYVGYLVKDHVKDHEVHGAGIYSNFRNDAVHVGTAIQYPEHGNIQCVNPFTVLLDNYGLIVSVANGKGEIADKQGQPARLNSNQGEERR